MDHRKSFPWIPVIALVVVNALWGFSFPVVKVLNEMSDLHFGVPHEHQSTAFRVIVSAWMIATRFTLALVLLGIFWNSLIRNATRQEWLAGFYIGLMFYFGLVLQVIGLATIPASRSGFLTSLTAVFTPLFGALIFRKYPTKSMVLGIALAVVGVVVLTGLVVRTPLGLGLAPDAADRWTIGDTLTTLGSMFFAFQVLFLDHYGKRINSVAVTPSMFLTAAVLGWITVGVVLGTSLRPQTGVAGMAFGDWVGLSIRPIFLTSLVGLAVLCSMLAFGWMNKYQPCVSASQAAVIYSLEPVFASAWALFLPGWLSMLSGIEHSNEQVTWSLLLGGLLILFANVVALYPSGPLQRATNENASIPADTEV
jgi:drug/metabolite transporter (DMT)-like permease